MADCVSLVWARITSPSIFLIRVTLRGGPEGLSRPNYRFYRLTVIDIVSDAGQSGIGVSRAAAQSGMSRDVCWRVSLVTPSGDLQQQTSGNDLTNV